MDGGGKVTATLTSKHYRRSPHVLGWMEIACLMRSSVPGTWVNLLVLERFKAIISKIYTEPKEETILGSFLVPTTDETLQRLMKTLEWDKLGEIEVKRKLCAGISLKVKTYGYSSLINHSSMRYETNQILKKLTLSPLIRICINWCFVMFIFFIKKC